MHYKSWNVYRNMYYITRLLSVHSPNDDRKVEDGVYRRYITIKSLVFNQTGSKGKSLLKMLHRVYIISKLTYVCSTYGRTAAEFLKTHMARAESISASSCFSSCEEHMTSAHLPSARASILLSALLPRGARCASTVHVQIL